MAVLQPYNTILHGTRPPGGGPSKSEGALQMDNAPVAPHVLQMAGFAHQQCNGIQYVATKTQIIGAFQPV